MQIKQTSNIVTEVRLDIWLWAARFYKTRSLAVQAIKKGRILVNQQRAKPARKIILGDILDIQKATHLQYEVSITGLETKRAGAKIAQTFYQETELGYLRRLALEAQQKVARDMVEYPSKKPEKHERRQLREIRHHYDD